MNETIIKNIASDLGINQSQVKTVLNLLSEDNTVPFIARYRKEATGNLDEQQIQEINKVYEYEVNLLKRKEDVIRLIDEKGMLTDEIHQEILNAKKLIDVEDIYRPYKEKKKTKASEAIKHGLQGLADFILTFSNVDPKEEALKYLNENVESVDKALEGAKYIIAEKISDNPVYRKFLRNLLFDEGIIVSSKKKNAEDPKGVYEIYYEYSEPVSKSKPHRILALNRAESEKIVTVKIDIEQSKMISYLEDQELLSKKSPSTIYVKEAIEDSLKRLIFPSIEREIRAQLTEVAEERAIEIFSLNLENLLLQPPLIGKKVLGVDPAFRTGCKLAVVNEQGTLLQVGVINPHLNERGMQESEKTLREYIKKFDIDLIAIGNGTASRETEELVARVVSNSSKCKYVIVNEAGASVYSASKLAISEFPDLTVEKRSAVSIARRLQDPLSELVKIDPKSIGVGQYQHDVSQKKLNESLSFVVTQAVNSVGVDLNTASVSLLSYVSGISSKVAESIVDKRNSNGRFNSRNDLLNVKNMGDKTFEQAAGFLRIYSGDEILDITSIHPESYDTARLIMKKFEITPDMIGKPDLKLLLKDIDIDSLAKSINSDKYTVEEIINSFIQPIRDPRDSFPQPILKSGVLNISDVHVGMEIEGTVRNVVDFGVFVDIGLHNDGLLHISKISTKFVKHPSDVLSVGDIVKVSILGIDEEKEKVSLTMIKPTDLVK